MVSVFVCVRHLGYPSCPYYDTQYRGIGASSIIEVGVYGWVIVYPNPNSNPATLDTRGLNTSTPDIPQWTFYYEGERQLQIQSNISENCSSTVTSVAQTVTYNVVKCEPFWYADNRHLDAATINIFLPSNSPHSSALDAAISDWNSYLSGTGVTLNRVTSSCTAGPQCVNVVTQALASGDCGEADPQGLSGSGVAQDPVIRMNSNMTFTATGRQRTLAHEIGHLLGMANYDLNCLQADAVMQDNFNCEDTVSQAVKMSDWLPVKKSVYGNGPKNKCGW